MTGEKDEPGPDRGVLRASDADRNAVAERLQAALAEGRLDLVDYDERLRDAYAATTYADLDKLTADLPAVVADRLPAARKATETTRRGEQLEEWRSWGGGAVIMIAIWGVTSLVSGDLIPFWPAVPLGIWAAVLIAHLITGDSGRRDRKHDIT